DPGSDLVRPAHLLRLLLVLAEVAGGVEELLRDDRGAQALSPERNGFAGLVGAAAHEVGAQVGHVEDADLVALDPPGPCVVAEGHEASHASTSSAFLSGGKTGKKSFAIRPASRISVTRLYSVAPSNSNVGRPSAVPRRRSGSAITG